MTVLGIDPGREKCGLAVVSEAETVWQGICDTKTLTETCKLKIEKYQIKTIAIGNGTSSKQAIAILRKDLGDEFHIISLDEYRTTDAARALYWRENPPKGLKRFIPVGMLVPPVPVDDYAARILARRYLAARQGAMGK